MLMRKKAMQRINPLRTILPSQTAEVIDHAMMEHAKNKKNSEALSIKLQFTWDGKNTTVRRRSRKLDSGQVRPGQKSSGLRKN